VPLGLDFIAWGAWEHEMLVGCIALCKEHHVSILRGPEVAHSRRKVGIGRRLLKAAEPELANHTCYCVAYGFLLRVYRDAGFRRCTPGEGPDFLRRRVRDFCARGWDVELLVHSKR
jgi:GNAT superfamily N-acetyltransferase